MKTSSSTRLARGLGWALTLATSLSTDAAAGLPPVPPGTTVDLNGDQQSDLVLAVDDRLWIRRSTARPESTWEPLRPAPDLRAPIESMTAGDLDGDNVQDLLLTGPAANQAVILFGQSNLAMPLRTARLELPGGVLSAAWVWPRVSGAATAYLLATANLRPYVARAQRATAEPITSDRFFIEIDGVQDDQVLDIATYDDPTSRLPLLAFLAPSPGPSGPRADQSVLYVAELDPTGKIHRRKWPDITLKRGYLSLLPGTLPDTFGTPALVAWAPGAPTFSTLVPRAAPAGSDLITEEITFVMEKMEYHRAPGSRREADRYLALGEGGGTLVIFQWSRAGRLESLETISPPQGQRFGEARLLEDGSLATLFAPADPSASPELIPWRLGVYQATEGKRELAFVQELPSGSQRSPRPRVIVYDRDPFAHPTAFELQSFPAGDWSRGGLIGRGNIAVTIEVFRDRRRGLGDDASQFLEVGVPLPAGAFLLPNQWESDSSVFFGGSPATPGLAAVAPNPPPGTYAQPTVVTWTVAEGITLVSRPAGGIWREGTGSYRLATSTTLEFYGVNRAGEAGPRRQAHYQIAEPDAKPSGPLKSDTDMDGMDDGWERLLFGGLEVKAADDADSDGFGAADEYRAGTDPRNAASRPAGSHPTPPVLAVTLAANGQPILRWPGTSGTRYQVEVSIDLIRWTPATSPPAGTTGTFEWRDETPRAELRFYRVVALP